MKRLVLEFSGTELGTEHRFRKVELFEVLHILRLVPEEFAALVRAKFVDGNASIEDLFPGSRYAHIEYELLDQDKGGFITYFIRVRFHAGRQRPQLFGSIVSGTYLAGPIEFKNGKVKVTFLGDSGQVGCPQVNGQGTTTL
jgi:hypothetical protein